MEALGGPAQEHTIRGHLLLQGGPQGSHVLAGGREGKHQG